MKRTFLFFGVSVVILLILFSNSEVVEGSVSVSELIDENYEVRLHVKYNDGFINLSGKPIEEKVLSYFYHLARIISIFIGITAIILFWLHKKKA